MNNPQSNMEDGIMALLLVFAIGFLLFSFGQKIEKTTEIYVLEETADKVKQCQIEVMATRADLSESKIRQFCENLY